MYSNPNPPEGRLIPASTSFGRLAGIGSLTGGFRSFDWRVLGRVLAGFETMTWEDGWLARHFGWRRPTIEVASPGTPALPPPTGGNSLRPARRNPPPYMVRLSALLDETLRLTCVKVRRRVVRSTAESCLEYGGESERDGRRVVRTRSESLAGLMRRYPTPLAISVDRLGLFGQPTRRLRWTDRGTSVDRHCPLG